MRILIAILFVIASLPAFAQKVDTVFNGYLRPFNESSGSAPTWNFQAVFRNPNLSSNGFDTTGLAGNARVLITTDGSCYELPITVLSAPNPIQDGSIITGTVNDPSGELASVNASQAAIYLPEEGLIPDNIAGLRDDLSNCVSLINISEHAVDSSSSVFDSGRNILRVPGVGDNIGGGTVTEWLEWWYFTAPTISLAQSPSTTVVEIGTETQYTYTATTTNTGAATLSNGSLFIVSGDELDDFAATTPGNATIDFTPLQTPADTFDSPTYQFRATQDWVFGSESGTATSNTRTISAVYPVFYGMVADTATAFADIYGTMDKLVETEGGKTVSYTGSGLIFYCMPDTWGDTNLSSIIDPNGFNVTASFTRVTYPEATSTGLTNNYTDAGCDCYFLNTGSTTTSSSDYTFNR